MKQTQQYFRILQRGGLLEKDQAVDHRKIRSRKPRSPALYLSIERGPSLRNFLEQLRDRALYSSRVPEVNPHPVGGGKLRCIRRSNLADSRGILRFPTQRVVVA